MTIFDLLFLVSFLGTLGLVAWAAVRAVRGQREVALLGLRRLAMFWGAYFVVLIAVSLASPRRVLAIGENQCWDDWCVAVASVRRAPAGDSIAYVLTLRVSSRARGRTQRGPVPEVYFLDGQNRRYQPDTAADAPAEGFVLAPGEAATFERRYQVPADARDPVVVLSHGGSGMRFPGCCIIGANDSLLHEPIVVRLD